MQPELTSCQCVKHGKYEAWRLPGLPPIVDCPHCVDEQYAKREAQHSAAAAKHKRASMLKDLRSIAGIPPRFADRTLDDYEAIHPGQNVVLSVCRSYAKTWPEQHRKGGSLVFTGRPGTGKTHLACAIANQVMAEHLASAAFGTVSKILRSIRCTYGGKSERTEEQALEALLIPDLLIVDEVGAQTGSDHELQLMFELVNNRYQNLRPTILISNLNATDLEQFLGNRTMDRFRECGTVLAFDWVSHRSDNR